MLERERVKAARSGKGGTMEMRIIEFIDAAAKNKVIELVVLAIVFDTIFGVLRAAREKKFNSCAGIDGAIRKIGCLYPWY